VIPTPVSHYYVVGIRQHIRRHTEILASEVEAHPRCAAPEREREGGKEGGREGERETERDRERDLYLLTR